MILTNKQGLHDFNYQFNEKLAVFLYDVVTRYEGGCGLDVTEDKRLEVENMPGWRTMVINEKSDLTIRDAQVLASGKNTAAVPLDQLRQILVNSLSCMVDAGAIAAAAEGHFHMLFCGDKHLPVCELIPLVQHHEAAGAVIDQAEWKQTEKDNIWKEIVLAKLRNQFRLLREKNCNPPPRFIEYCKSIVPGDKTNRESLAARMYFSSLFGHEFRRHAADETNSKLNYGYTILLPEANSEL